MNKGDGGCFINASELLYEWEEFTDELINGKGGTPTKQFFRDFCFIADQNHSNRKTGNGIIAKQTRDEISTPCNFRIDNGRSVTDQRSQYEAANHAKEKIVVLFMLPHHNDENARALPKEEHEGKGVIGVFSEN